MAIRIQHGGMPDSPSNQDKLTFDAFERLKSERRAELLAMHPDEAQELVNSVLQPQLWRVADPRQLEWPGDLADDLNEDESNDCV